VPDLVSNSPDLLRLTVVLASVGCAWIPAAWCEQIHVDKTWNLSVFSVAALLKFLHTSLSSPERSMTVLCLPAEERTMILKNSPRIQRWLFKQRSKMSRAGTPPSPGVHRLAATSSRSGQPQRMAKPAGAYTINLNPNRHPRICIYPEPCMHACHAVTHKHVADLSSSRLACSPVQDRLHMVGCSHCAGSRSAACMLSRNFSARARPFA
jgi:hypothetical protein